ncbi:zinc finger protein 568-like isoform X3 [Girardinichthys multiradiatus]|uniref:zinc finger protein 568-like isoform X3 n=1 Tax=Girardinichthys multiradiatus TaxID=208333 RepID=UPI001FADF8A3|nr:zinc finger protein 568-like isoform X3 [Girardinichthys multiradiatus]
MRQVFYSIMSVTTWEVAAGHFLITKERNSVLDENISDTVEIKKEWEDRQPQSIDEKQVELCIFQNEEQLLVKEETNTSLVTPAYKEIFHNGPELQQMMETKEELELEIVQIKEEQEDFCCNLEGQILVKQEYNTLKVTAAHEETFHREPELVKIEQEEPEPKQMIETKDGSEPWPVKEEQVQLCIFQDEEQLLVKQETDSFILTPTDQNDSSEPETIKNHLLCSTCPEDKNQHQQGNTQQDSGSNNDKELRPKKRCKKPRKQGDNLDISKLIEHKKKLPLCEVCGKCFTTRQILIVHMRTHTGEKPFSCLTCGKGFPRQPALTAHMRTHTGEKPYPCELCEKSYRDRSNLVRHMRTHTGEKPYSCKVCGKSYSGSSQLTYHITTHTGEKPFSCLTCGKAFNKQSTLTVHIRTHTGEKPYSCDLCEKSFRESNDLTCHMRTHTGEKPFFCELCKKSFRWRNVLNRHMRTHR